MNSPTHLHLRTQLQQVALLACLTRLLKSNREQ
jgi:hypothetical protein